MHILASIKKYLSLIFLSCLLCSCGKKELHVAAFQYRISADKLTSSAMFWKELEVTLETALKDKAVDLVILPEYIGALYPLSFYYEDWKLSETFEEAFISINKEGRYSSLREFYIAQSPGVYMDWIQNMGRFAREQNTYIIAGSLFFFDPETLKLTNRAMVFNPRGEVFYVQDKVYLTPFEINMIKLDPSTIDKASLFGIRGHKIGVTICRDTFFSAWNQAFAQADLWVDIKANGEVYQSDQASLFERALPKRIQETGIPMGITVCLTGSIFDLVWQGISRLDEPMGKGPTLAAENPEDQLVLHFSVETLD